MSHSPASLRSFLAGTFLLLFSLVTPLAAGDAELDRFVETGMSLWSVPGMAVAVASSDAVAFQKGFGATSFENGSPVDEHTLFAIASTTKAMVVAGILMLVDDGKLALDDPATKYLPELHFEDPLLTDQVTVRDLLTHRIGLPSTDLWAFFMNMPLAEQIRRLGSVPADYRLRDGFVYQNTMYELVGLVIQRVSGQPWHEFLARRLWQPVGMQETFAARGLAGKQHLTVMPHEIVDGEPRHARWDEAVDETNAAGSVWSSVHDMTLWAQFLLRGGVTADGERLISEQRIEEMFRPQQLVDEAAFYPASELSGPHWRSYGLGWFQQDFQGRKIDFHTGSLSGLIAIIGLDRDNDKAVIVLGNRDHAEMRHAVLWYVMDETPLAERRDWNREVFDLYQSNREQGEARWAEREATRLEGTEPSLDLGEYAGAFSHAAWGTIDIRRDDDRLVLVTPNYEFPLSHWHLDAFLLEYPLWGWKEFVSFKIGPDGRVVSMEFAGEVLAKAAAESSGPADAE
ncbi:MAG: serine hydrolase [Xanthomonadales bacterium]|nr:serine hydrolase [Xanthomonadales bacterium]